ncbi:hypothetical protein [Spirosoma agri]|uniref:DUF4595 domain-containing protein n=1 Tax=Spirosoma agri TaxID=1987381 RepID=A0A6M0IE46_9BACT|nr:hypothetical protein [Spirosoma agri]NEU66002.1 hypothetical protein [Spirosoma agri]
MIRSLRCLWLSLIVLASVVVGCQNDPNPQKTRYRVSKAVQTAFNSDVTMIYQYDSLGRLQLVNEYPTVSAELTGVTPTAQTIIYYKSVTSEQIDRVDRRLTRPVLGEDGLEAGTQRLYHYDNQGRLSYVKESKALNGFTAFKLIQAFQYEYKADNLPLQLIVSGPPPLLERNIYTYKFDKGNAVHIDLTVVTARTTTPRSSESDVTFDKAPGVYSNFFAIYPGITSFNKNNVINANTTMINNERGLLAKRIKKGAYVDEVTEYTYELY